MVYINKTAKNVRISASSGMAIWAIGTVWLIVFFVLEHFDPVVGEELVDWIQAIVMLLLLPFYPFVRKKFAAWLAKSHE